MLDLNFARTDLNLLVIFDAIARTRSVTAAADRLALSQPAVSHALKRLRDMVDDPLFVRSGKGLVATPRAEAMTPLVADWLQTARRIVVAETFDPATATQTFRIATSDFGMTAMAPAIVRLIRKLAPRSQIEFAAVDPDVPNRLTRGDLDLAFFGLAPPDPGILSRELFRDRLVGLVCSAHPLAGNARRGGIGLNDYLAFPHVAVSFGLQGASQIDMALTRRGLTRRVAMRSPNFAVNVAALRGSDLIMSLPSRMATALRAPGFVVFEIPLDLDEFPYLMVWGRRNDADPASLWLRGVVAGAAAHAQEADPT